MLSAILYGRNDSHGYNLHKRAALSLNCIAEVLAGETDEIIFVDYNTPDELPTFIEAIGDTLTDRCKRLLRVLRVRPSQHARLAGPTRLVALESQSRNIAVRRANPANKWILSTNTDMIFCPLKGHASLTDVIGGLKDGFYHLPRYEVPEGFWERLDRMDPVANIAAMAANARRFHLNEIVYGAYDNLYEAPGDFQLFLREDLEAIRGFDESMILGWHVDSNIARRMRLLRGKVETAVGELNGYHCGHTRQATSLHGGNRTENDFHHYVADVSSPVADSQADNWGAPGEAIEEIRLTTADRYFDALSAAVKAEGPASSEATYNDSSFNKVTYGADHVLPHLCDLLFNLPGHQTVLYFGADRALLGGLHAFLTGAGRDPSFLVPDLPALIGDTAAWTDVAAAVPLTAALEQADLIVLQYPSADVEPLAARHAQEWLCQRFLFSLAAVEEARQKATGSPPRRIMVVNGIHNGLTQPLEYLLAPTVMPFSSRIRQGFLTASVTAADRPGVEQPVYERLRRRLPFSVYDRGLIDRVIGSLKAGKPLRGWERLAPEIAAIASAPAVTAKSFGLSQAQADAALQAAADAMVQPIARLAEPPKVVGPREGIGNRLCSGSDWDSAPWLQTAAAFFNLDALDFRNRTRWMWERVSLADAAQRHLPVNPFDAAAPRPRVLFIADAPDSLAAILAHIGYEVRYALAEDFVAGRASANWKAVLESSSLTFPDTWKPFDPAEGGKFQAMVSPLPCLFERNAEALDAVLAGIHQHMQPGALFLVTAPVQINEVAYEGALGLAEWKTLYAPSGPLGARGFAPVGGMDASIPLDSAVRYAFEDNPQETMRGLSYGFFASFITPALIAAAWPADLRPAPAQRAALAPSTDLSWTVPVPYLGAKATLEILRGTGPAQAQGLAGRAAQVLDSGLASIPLGPLARNVLPSAVTPDGARRSPTGLSLEAEGDDVEAGPWLILSLDAGAADRLVLQVEGDAPIHEAVTVIHGVGSGPISIEGSRITADSREGPLGRVAVAVRFAASANLSRLTGWTEAKI
jgi:hypothetical protein